MSDVIRRFNSRYMVLRSSNALQVSILSVILLGGVSHTIAGVVIGMSGKNGMAMV